MKPIIGITADIDGDLFKLRHEYVCFVDKCGGLPLILPPSSDISGIAEAIDALLISGGNDLAPQYYGEDILVHEGCLKIVSKERSDFEFAILDEILKRNKPILGICYGMQLINAAFRGTLYQDIKHQVKNALNHKRGEHKLKIIKHLDLCADTAYIVNSTHHQAVKKLGKGLNVFAASDDRIIEGFYKKGYPFLIGVQWHPERGLTRKNHNAELLKYDKLSLAIFKKFINTAKAIKRQYGN